MHNKLKSAIEYHNDGYELRSFQCLAEVSNMIDDLFAYKNIDINVYKRM